MTILVSGASSPLGSALVDRLRLGGREPVIGVARSSCARRPDHVICDVCDADALGVLLNRYRPRLVYHLVAQYSGELKSDLAVNAWSARSLLEIIRQQAMGCRVLLVGSAAEYGAVQEAENPISEDRVLRPVSVYGLTKAFQSQLAIYHAAAFEQEVVVARLFNLIAPNSSERLFVGRVQRMISEIKAGVIDLLEVGNLDSIRDYVSLDKALHQLTVIAERGHAGNIYHVASGKPLKIRDLLGSMLSEAGLDWNHVRQNDSARARSGYDVPMIYADVTKTLALESGRDSGC